MPEEWRQMTDDQLAQRADDGLRGQGPVIESTRRLPETLHQEEVAIKRLTKWLVAMTGALVLMTLVLVYLTVRLLNHGG